VLTGLSKRVTAQRKKPLTIWGSTESSPARHLGWRVGLSGRRRFCERVKLLVWTWRHAPISERFATVQRRNHYYSGGGTWYLRKWVSCWKSWKWT